MKRKQEDEELKLRVHVQPRARKNAILGMEGGTLKVRIASPPVAGVANRELKKFLARALGIPASRVEIVSGHTSRHKTVKIIGVCPERMRAIFQSQEGPEGAE